MFCRTRFKSALADGQRLKNIRSWRRQAGADIPQPPRGPGDEGFDEQRNDVMIMRMARGNSAHLRGICIVPEIALLGWNGRRLLAPAALGLDEPVLERRRAMRQRARLLNMRKRGAGGG